MSERILDLSEIKCKDVREQVLYECSLDTIINELIVLSDKSKLKEIATKPGCYFILSRNSECDDWVFRNIGTYHASVRERLRQHCYAPKNTQPHSQKYEVDKSSEEWAVTYRIIQPIELRYSVEEYLIKHFQPIDNEKHKVKGIK